MDCRALIDEELAEAYLSGRLGEPEREEWERHLFECDTCAEAMRALGAARGALSERAATRAPLRAHVWARRWIPSAAAVAVAAGAVLFLWRAAEQPSAPPADASLPTPLPSPEAPVTPEPEPDWPALAAIRPAAYSEPVLRHAPGEAEWAFRDAMRLYMRGEYRGAIPGLERAAAEAVEDAGPRFFLGVSHLLEGDPDSAIAALEAVKAMGDTPYLEEAQIYLARARLLTRAPEAAERELESAIALRGDLTQEAADLLAAIRRARDAGR